MNRPFIPLCALLLVLAACSTTVPSSLPTPTSLFPGVPSPAPVAPVEPGATLAAPMLESTLPAARSKNEFRVAVIADRTTQTVTREQADAVIAEASGYLREFSPIGLAAADFAEDGSGGRMADIANRYIASHAGSLPDGLVIFSSGDQGEAKTNGGYGYTVQAPAGFRNPFSSPVAGSSQIYVAVVDYSFQYMPCGYGGGNEVKSGNALPGECRGQTGIACVQNNGYSMCSNAAGNLYTSTPTHAVASMVIHGLLHNFGPNGDQDHYATDQCNARMGYPAGFFDLQESEYYNGLCPFVYEEFTKGYQP